jgi:ubiquinone/menaquinone biosynthesis C-methylase UbiE
MGCGKARIANHFKGNKKFKFYNYDHYAFDDSVKSCDIKELPHEEHEINIAILCLAMWGSNCKDYIKEANRVLEQHGTLLIIEPSKRWTTEDGSNRLE